MMYKANSKDQSRVLDLLKDDPSRSLFITGDILQNGMECDFQEVWLDEDDLGVHVIYLRYRTNLIIYVVDEVIDHQACVNLIQDPRIHMVSGTLQHFNFIPLELREKLEIHPMYFCECKTLKPGNYPAIRAKQEDVQGICVGLADITEFNRLEALPLEERIQHMTKEFENNMKVAFILKEDGKVVAHAASSAQSNVGLMVVAVFTLEAYRHRGYARQVVGALTHWSLDQGLIPCLFYDNPQAGKLYHDLGYVTFDQWVIGKKMI